MLQRVIMNVLEINGKTERFIKEIEDMKRNQMGVLELKNSCNLKGQ